MATISPLYTEINKIMLTSIPDKFAVPSQLKASLSMWHSSLIDYVANHYRDTNRYRQLVCDGLNILTYCAITSEVPNFDWSAADPFQCMPQYDMAYIEQTVGKFFLKPNAIIWNISPAEVIDTEIRSDTLTKPVVSNTRSTDSQINSVQNLTPKSRFSPAFNAEDLKIPEATMDDKPWVESEVPRIVTQKEDLWLAPPLVPRFDRDKVWFKGAERDDVYVIYTRLPEVPEVQRDINITTDPRVMTDAEFMNLYPDHFIPTRKPALYQRVDGIDYDEQLGCIIPIQGFTREQVLDNIIKYPHFYRLRRIVDPTAYADNPISFADGVAGFYQDIEIEGELVSTMTVWDSLPESKIIPRQSDFIKEYVIRRYLLERDNGIQHKYPLHGILEPYITLFMPPEMYAERGYIDPLEIVKQCVRSRILFYRSQNPMLKRLGVNINELPLF